MADQREQELHAARIWTENTFKSLATQYRIKIVWGGWRSNMPAAVNIIYFNIQGEDDTYYIPDKDRGFMRFAACGNPDPANDSVRDEIKHQIRRKFDSLIR